MVDVFMIHRASGTSEQKLRIELLKSRALASELAGKLGALEATHDQLVNDYLVDAEAMRATKRENEKLKSELARLKGIEESLSRDIAPIMLTTMMSVTKLNRDIELWSAASTGGVPCLPIEPGMKEGFASLQADLAKHIKAYDHEKGEIVELFQ